MTASPGFNASIWSNIVGSWKCNCTMEPFSGAGCVGDPRCESVCDIFWLAGLTTIIRPTSTLLTDLISNFIFMAISLGLGQKKTQPGITRPGHRINKVCSTVSGVCWPQEDKAGPIGTCEGDRTGTASTTRDMIHAGTWTDNRFSAFVRLRVFLLSALIQVTWSVPERSTARLTRRLDTVAGPIFNEDADSLALPTFEVPARLDRVNLAIGANHCGTSHHSGQSLK